MQRSFGILLAIVLSLSLFLQPAIPNSKMLGTTPVDSHLEASQLGQAPPNPSDAAAAPP